jgi:hypothetical protein
VPLPAAYWPFLGATALAYGVTVHSLEVWLTRTGSIG